MDIDARAKLLLETRAGISPAGELVYIPTLIYFCFSCINSFDRFEVALHSGVSRWTTFSYLHETLIHAASVSRFFFPVKHGKSKQLQKLHIARAIKMRTALNIDEKNLLEDRRMRDVLEHFDERLDRFLLENQGGVFQPTPQILDNDNFDTGFEKHFLSIIPSKQQIVLLNERFNYGDVVAEVRALLSRAQQLESAGYLLH